MSYAKTVMVKDSDYDPDVEGLFYVAWKMENVAECMAENGFLDEGSVYACRFWDYGENEDVDRVCDFLERNEIIDNLYDSEKINKKIVGLIDKECKTVGLKRIHKSAKDIIFMHCTGGRYIGSVEWFEDDVREIIDILGYDASPDILNFNDIIIQIGDKIYDILTDDDVNDDIATAIVNVCEELNIEKVQG